MRILLSLAILPSLAACDSDGVKPDTGSGDTDTDSATDTDSGSTECAVTVTGSSPENGEAGVYYRQTLTVNFDGDAVAADASVSVLDEAGVLQPVQLEWSEGNVQALAYVVLEANSAYTLSVDVCETNTSVGFMTSSVGTPLSIDPSELMGRTYSFRISDATITEPAFLNVVADSYLTVPILLGVVSASDTEVDFLGALGEQDDFGAYTQYPDIPTWDFPPASFAEAPYFEAASEGIVIMYGDVPIPIEDFTLSGTFSSDGARIEEGHVTGLGDTRYLGELMVGRDDPNAACDIAEAAGVACEPCNDGEPYCMFIVAEDITATYQAGLTLEEN
jgi:hypothetical protein